MLEAGVELGCKVEGGVRPKEARVQDGVDPEQPLEDRPDDGCEGLRVPDSLAGLLIVVIGEVVLVVQGLVRPAERGGGVLRGRARSGGSGGG